MKSAYLNYLKTGDENFLRNQVINEINYPDFLEGSKFIKQQKNQRAEEIMIQVLQTFNRYDLLEKVFFTAPEDKFYRDKYKGVYYLTLINNFKTEELLRLILEKIETVNRTMEDRRKKFGTVNPQEVNPQITLELIYLKEIARLGERQFPQLEAFIRGYPLSEPKTRKQEIILNHFYSASVKKDNLKKVYQYWLSFIPPGYTEEPPSTPPPSETETKTDEPKTNASPPADLNDPDDFFELGEPSPKLSATEKKPENEEINLVDSAGIAYGLMSELSQADFLNTLYQHGYYRSYLHLFKNLLVKLYPKSRQHNQLASSQRERISRALTYAHQSVEDFWLSLQSSLSKSPAASLPQLFYDNAYQKIINNYKPRQQSDLYLLSLAAVDRWDTLFQIIQSDKALVEEYQLIRLLVKNPGELLTRLKSSPTEKLQSWQLDFLNLAEEELSPEQIAPVIVAFLFKKKNFFLSQPKQPALLYEYGIVSQGQILWEAGQTQEVNQLFREYYNRMTFPVLKEKLMFLHGMAYLDEDPQEAEKILFRLLTINPQSAYRFDIEEALNSTL